ncbi:MAG TPA: GNAT family N-acetyltransferase [Egibacteraceae bacterium]|nr:GNAT family N-acetyltransferase [Egibacteraceae bacterium]
MTESSELVLLPLSDPSAWDTALRRVGQRDVYHSSAYHRCIRSTEGGDAYLFVLSSPGGDVAAMPFLVRRVATVEGLEDRAAVDATSVEGYPGAVCSPVTGEGARRAFRRRFQGALLEVLTDLGVVTFFGRQNPFHATEWLFDGVGEIRRLGSTVAVDCITSEDEHQGQMSSHHRRNLRKVRREGLRMVRDPDGSCLPEFVAMYRQTMDRVGATAGYYYPDDYFRALMHGLGDDAFLAIAELDGEPVNGALFLQGPSVVHYHLGGTSEQFRNLGASHVLFDEVRRWCKEGGRRWLHLGGGVGAGEDSLFRFKSGFSKERFPYHVVRLVVDQDAAEELVAQRHAWLSAQGLTASTDFFPAYRAPAVKPDPREEG